MCPGHCSRAAGRQVFDREFWPAAHRAWRRRGDSVRRCGPSPGRNPGAGRTGRRWPDHRVPAVVPDVSLQPEVVLLGLLPLLVYDAAVTSSPTAFSRNARPIGMLAVLLVLATACGVAAVVHWLGHLSWPIAFVLGTAVGPTDASAATSIASRLSLPRRLITILEGEALFNDATALVLYAAAVAAATTGHFSAARTAAAIVYSTVAGGTAVGPTDASAATSIASRLSCRGG